MAHPSIRPSVGGAETKRILRPRPWYTYTHVPDKAHWHTSSIFALHQLVNFEPIISTCSEEVDFLDLKLELEIQGHSGTFALWNAMEWQQTGVNIAQLSITNKSETDFTNVILCNISQILEMIQTN